VAWLVINFGDQLTDEEIDLLAVGTNVGDSGIEVKAFLTRPDVDLTTWPFEALGVALMGCTALLPEGDPAVGRVLKEVARRLREAAR